jgi:hypothetical protein
MKNAVGLWIDHRKAVIVAVTDRGETTSLIVSRVEKQLGRLAGVRSRTPFESQQVPADDRRERRFQGQLAVYYDAVIACIRGAASILVFGPGEAKVELTRRLERNKLGGRIVGIETIDKMTDRQIAAKVWLHFSRRRSATGRRPKGRASSL